MATPEQIWGYIDADLKLVESHLQGGELHQVHGLRLADPLSVSATARLSGTVAQTVSEGAGAITVERA